MAINRFNTTQTVANVKPASDPQVMEMRRKALIAAMGNTSGKSTPVDDAASGSGMARAQTINVTGDSRTPANTPVATPPARRPIAGNPDITFTPPPGYVAPVRANLPAAQMPTSSLTLSATPIGQLAQLKQEQAAARAAADADLKASKAQALQQARAKMNLSGGGLSGASGALEGDIGRVQDRSRLEALQGIDEKDRAEQMQTLHDAEDLYDLEESDGQDIDGDGNIGRPDSKVPLNAQQQTDADAAKSDDRQQYIADLKARNQTQDVLIGDYDTPDGKGGSKEEPLLIDDAQKKKMASDGFIFNTYTYRDFWGNMVEEWTDQYDNHYVVGKA